MDWSQLENVRRERPAYDLEPKADLEPWREGMQIYETATIRVDGQAAGLMCRALRHELNGRDILIGTDLSNTTLESSSARLRTARLPDFPESGVPRSGSG